LSDAKDRLKILLTIPLDIDIQVAAPLGYESLQLQMEQALEIALANRIELKQASGRVDEAQRKTRVSKKNLLPDLNVLMSYERVGTADDLRESIELDQNNWSVALLGDQSWPRTAEKAAVQQSLITVKTARLNLSLTRDEIEREVRDQLETLTRIENDIAIRQEQIRTSEGKLALAEIKFRYDMANNFDVIESENELERAKIDLLTARTEYIVGIYRMRSVLGTLIQ
jgi:outer membrane protein TolC